MEENTKISQAIEEIKNTDDEQLKQVILKWFERTHNQGMKNGATYIASAIYGAIEKNLKKGSQPSLRDYQRAIKRIVEIVSVQLTQQNDYNTNESKEEDNHDGTAG